MKTPWKLRISFVNAVALLLISSFPVARAQFAGPAMSATSTTGGAPVSAMHLEYQDVKIMPGDVISILTYGAPELSTTANTSTGALGSSTTPVPGMKVGSKGEMVLPYLGTVKIAGLTPPEASQYLAKLLKDGGFLVDPQVTVSLVESPTRVITVVGEVTKPEPVPAYGQLRLLDVISSCGGFTPLASHTITVRRPGETQPITVMLGSDPKNTDAANIPLMAGDTVLVPKVGSVFVVGQVKTPEAIALSSNTPITVLRAISISGGVLPGAALSKVTIIRRTSENQHLEITLDVSKVMKGKMKDVALMSDDVLIVPRNGFKAGMASSGTAIAGGAASGLVYRIP
jgi:polysaccharide export outer membrane protein